MVNFAALKKNSGSNLDKLAKAVEAMNDKKRYNNDNPDEFWKATLDKAGNGYAIIRFLPTPAKDSAVSEDALPWVKYYDHGFQGPNGWYIEKSLTSIGQVDAIKIYNSELWASGIPANIEQAKAQKARLHYVSNIYVVKDQGNPDNEGKVFKYIYGKKIFERLTQAMNPQFEDDDRIDPFDLWTGANFKLKVRKVDGQINYDLSEWATPGPLTDDDDKLEKIYNSEYSLLEILDPKNFKTPEELENRLKRVLGIDQPKTKFHQTAVEATKSKIEEEPTPLKEKSIQTETVPNNEEDEDDDLSYFSKLVDD